MIKRKRSSIGLALGSGVARGWAHIGVIKKLVEAGFSPDIVVGTSIGAVVGGAYVTGYMKELEDFARSLTKRRIFGMLDISLSGAGIFSGRRLSNELYDRMGDIRIEDISKTFIAVTTELATGHEIWIREGPLVDTLRASYALPGLFPPVYLDGRWLIDGALVNPVPTSVCRAFGARLVIAVNLNRDAFGKASTSKSLLSEENFKDMNDDKDITSHLREKKAYRTFMRQIFGTGKKTPGITTVMLAALNIVQDRLARSRLAGDPPDIHIAPRVGHISLIEFNRAEEAIKLGEEAVEEILPRLYDAVDILI